MALERPWSLPGTITKINDIEFDGDQLHSTGYDPYFLIGFDRPLPAGWYSCEAEIESDLYLRPKLYFDLGRGIREDNSVMLRKTVGGPYRSFCRIPKRLRRLRFDPAENLGALTVRDLRLRRVPTTKLIWEGIKRGIVTLRKEPRKIPTFLRDALGSLLPGKFETFRDANAEMGRDERRDRYRAWMEHYDFKPETDTARYKERLAGLADPPLISIVLPVYNTDEAMLDAAIASVTGQIYPNWELCIADDASTEPHIRPQLERLSAADSRIKVVFRSENGHIAQSSNSALELATGSLVTCLDHDDLLTPHALAEVALYMAAHPDCRLVYSDQDKIDGGGRRYEPFFKPDWSYDLLLSVNYLNHLTVYRTEDVRAAGGWRHDFVGSQDYDLTLRVIEGMAPESIGHIPAILYHWRATAGSTAMAVGEKSYAYDAGRRALSEHLERTGQAGSIEPTRPYPYYRYKRPVPQPRPSVTLIILTRDRADLLETCIETLLETTDYEPYDVIIVDNGSVEKPTFDLFERLIADPRIRVIREDIPFNFSKLNNVAAKVATGDYLCLVNNDIEFTEADWLDEMVSQAVRKDVGCVGAKLFYPDGRIQHAGVVIGIGGLAGHSHILEPGNAAGYLGRLVQVQDVSATTGAVLMTPRALYEELGGLEEENLSVAFNDIDYCLRVRAKGLKVIWTPHARMIHHESASRGYDHMSDEKRARMLREGQFMKDRWGDTLNGDPFYSPHLDRARGSFLPKA